MVRGHCHSFCHLEAEARRAVTEEIEAAGLTTVNAAMYTYPVHQAADILFCKGPSCRSARTSFHIFRGG